MKNSNGWNIRVLNLSFGTESTQQPGVDPLGWAAECAWRNGIVVVAAAGNDGGKVAGLANPAYNPNVLAVGAVDTRGTDAKDDDVVPCQALACPGVVPVLHRRTAGCERLDADVGSDRTLAQRRGDHVGEIVRRGIAVSNQQHR